MSNLMQESNAKLYTHNKGMVMKYTFTLEVQMEIPDKEEITELLQDHETVSDWIETEGNEVKQEIIALVGYAQNDTFLKHDYYLKPIVKIS